MSGKREVDEIIIAEIRIGLASQKLSLGADSASKISSTGTF